MASSSEQRTAFFPKADAAVISSGRTRPQTRPQAVGPIYDPDNVDKPIVPWSLDAEMTFYPPKSEAYAPASIPDRPTCLADRYLRASLAKNERLRLSMLWYYTRDIIKEDDFLSGLQEKLQLAQESTGWEFAVIGIQDVNFYIRLATIGLPVAILPRGETICAHTVIQPPGSVFLLPNMMEDWRFQESPYVELGGLVAYAGAPLRLQNESGDCVCLGSLCVASSTNQETLTKPQQNTLARLADWVVSDIIQCTRVRRQRERYRMSGLVSTLQKESGDAVSEDSVLGILKTTYPDAAINLQSSKAAHIEIEGRGPILQSDLRDGLWEDIDYLDGFIANSNHQELPSTRVVRVMTAQCESISGSSLLVVASKNFQLVFDDIDLAFVQACANMLSHTWQKRLLAEVMNAKEVFLRGICHQLRTPIHGILGSVDLLIEELTSRNAHGSTHATSPLLQLIPGVHLDEPSTYLDTIRTAGRDLISIVNSMITLNRWADIAKSDRRYAIHTVYELETELANEILKATSGSTHHRPSVIFVYNLPPDCAGLRTDPSLLRDSLLPLIINAIQHTSEGIVAVTISIRPDSKELIVDVRDTGRGIHPDHQQRIFELYEKVDSYSAGAGLGLTLASKFAALLRGSVVLVSSGLDRGSHFRVTFREVECSLSSPSSPPLVSTLKHIPSTFHNMATSSANVSLCDYFAGFLTSHGFTSSDRMEGCFIILDFIPDSIQRHTYLSQISPEQVAICLIAASEKDVCLEQTLGNVIYVNGPFLTSTMSSAIVEADRVLSSIRASRPRHEPSLMLPKLDEITSADKGTSTDGGMSTDRGTSADDDTSTEGSMSTEESPGTDDWSGSAVHSPFAKAQSVQVSRDSPTDLGLGAAVLRISTDPTRPAWPIALLVDDNTVNLRILQMYCSKRGLPYHCATDGRQAVDIFTRCQSSSATGEGAAIQLILMDLQMPVCDGIEATRQIRLLEKQNGWRDSTLFIVTGQDSPADRTDADAAGADEYFVKPVGIKVLDVAVRRYFAAFDTREKNQVVLAERLGKARTNGSGGELPVSQAACRAHG